MLGRRQEGNRGRCIIATYSRVHLSGSVDGKPIVVAAIATPGTLLHTAIAGSVSFDEEWFWATNVTAAPVTLTVEWGGVTDPANHLVKQYSIPANSPPVPIATGFVLNNGAVVRAFASVANAINVVGFINRIS